MRDQFIKSVEKFQSEFDLNLSEEKIFVLADYYEHVFEKNEFLHLVAACSAEEFAIRHVLESIYAAKFLKQNTKFADIGTGAGLPAIPCLIVRDDLNGVLIESKLKKADFLSRVLVKTGLENRAEIFDRQFEELQTPDVSYVLCRALDKFTKKLPRILIWSGKSKFIFFGGNNIFEVLQTFDVSFEKILLPMSEQRFIFVSN